MHSRKKFFILHKEEEEKKQFQEIKFFVCALFAFSQVVAFYARKTIRLTTK
jgi:hypothetical protein